MVPCSMHNYSFAINYQEAKSEEKARERLEGEEKAKRKKITDHT